MRYLCVTPCVTPCVTLNDYVLQGHFMRYYALLGNFFILKRNLFVFLKKMAVTHSNAYKYTVKHGHHAVTHTVTHTVTHAVTRA